MVLWPDREADGANEPTTPSKIGTRDEMGRLEKVCPQCLCAIQHFDGLNSW